VFENEKLANSAGRSNRSPGFLVPELLAHHAMTNDFKVGDHVGWNSEAGRVRGTIQKKITSAITFKGYMVHASKEEPQYLIKSDTTDDLAMHKGSALEKLQK
jgi:Hypervirulence associated proteins TUDOR domain